MVDTNLILSEDGKTVLGVHDRSVAKVVIPDGVVTIGAEAFYECTSLQSIFIPSSVLSFGESAFFGCSSLRQIDIPNSVKCIGNRALKWCYLLQRVVIPNSTTSIGDEAFFGCSSLQCIDIPDSVTSIGEGAFGGCKIGRNKGVGVCFALECINVSPDNPHYRSIDGILYDKNVTKIIHIPQGKQLVNYSIPETVISIDERTFSGCLYLQHVIIPNSVKVIGDRAFEVCESLQEIDIPRSVVSIGERAFAGCKSLQRVFIPESVISIGESVFGRCEFQILMNIGGCTALESIDVDPQNPHYTSIDGVLYNKAVSQLIKFPEAKHVEDFVLPDSVTSIADEELIDRCI